MKILIPAIQGWLSVDRAIAMYRLVMEVKPMVAVEIGVFGGRSLIATAIALKDIGKGKLYAIDSWKNKDCVEGEHNDIDSQWWSRVDLHSVHKSCMEHIWRLGLDKYVTVIRSASQDCHEIIPSGIGILYIDGNHSEFASCRDVELYLPKVSSGGFVWMDDCDWLTTKKAQVMMDDRCRLIRNERTYRLYQKP